ncbi:MAG: TonB-dependent receptor [Nitrospirales bacterium]|nr:MAG: TonB-dependent receptor [Nitrospirales bacterium]
MRIVTCQHFTKMKLVFALVIGAVSTTCVLTIAIPFVTAEERELSRPQSRDDSIGPESKTSNHDQNDDASVQQLEPIHVFGARLVYPDLGARSLEKSQTAITHVPGGASVLNIELNHETALQDLDDALLFIPGVYIAGQNTVSEGTKIQIRGSGVRSLASPIRGISVFRNGIPLTRANGGTDTQTMNYFVWDHVEVFRGANALALGGSSLGGAINTITHTGRTAPGFLARTTFGSNEYFSPHLSYGYANEKFDAYAAISYVSSEGNRSTSNDHDNKYGFISLGYRWNDRHETRLIVDLQRHRWENGTTLTLAELKDNPRKNNRDPSDDKFLIPNYRVSLKHNVRTDQLGQFSFSTFYMRNDYEFPFKAFGFFEDTWEEVGFAARNEQTQQWFGVAHNLQMGVNTQYMWITDQNFSSIGGEKGTLTFGEDNHFFLLETYLQDRMSLTDKFDVLLGLQATYKWQEFSQFFPDIKTRTANSTGLSPKIGFTWQATDLVQIYGNVSRSFETKTLNNIGDLTGTNKIKDQEGTTVEIGTRGGSPLFSWELSYYYAWVQNELLVIEDPPQSTNFVTGNADDSIHTGIELGLASTIPVETFHAGDSIRMRGTYTWSNFTFDDDRVFGDNRLPGVPEHLGLVEILYQHGSGFYVGPNVKIATANLADFGNSLEAPSYTLVGMRAGYIPQSKRYRVFFEANNLTNKAYAESISITNNAGGMDRSLFLPGQTLSVFGGVEIRY